MAAYKDLVGQKITKVTSNPGEPKTGQMWYNSTTGHLRGLGIIEAWSSVANQTQNQRDGGYGQSTPSSASWFAGGVDASRNSTTTQEWNGNGWSNGGNINVGREEAIGFGLVNAAALAGGSTYPPSALKNEVEEYDGSSWTAVTALPAKRKQAAGAGTQTAGLVSFGAVDPPSAAGSITATALEYDGSSWTSGGTGSVARSQISGCGTQTAALAFGGHTSPSTTFPAATEEYNGSTWTTSGAMNTGRGLMAGNGIQTSALAYAGFTPYRDLSEKYDGTTWSNTPTLATARDRAHGGGPNSANGLCAGGLTSPGVISAVEEFTSSTNTITAGAWSSSGNMNSGRTSAAGFANKDDLVIAGGFISTPSPADDDSQNLVEEYNGSTWTAVTAMPTKRSSASGCGASQTSGMISGGIHTNQTTSVEYDGTNWTSGGAIPAVSRMAAHCGSVPAALRCGGAGNPGPAINQTIEYDSSTWTTGNTMPHAEYGHMLVGTQTAAVFSGGHNSPTRDNLYEWDGTNWTTSPATLAVSIHNNAGAAANGTQTAAMWFLGSSGTTSSQVYNGTSVVTQPSLGTARYNVNNGGGGTSTAAIVGGGDNDVDATEEFTGETTTINIADFTTS